MTTGGDGDDVAPPAYSAQDNGNRADAPPSVDVDVTASFAQLTLDQNIADRKLSVNTCLAHLKLIHAIHNLKEEVGYTDGLFGLYDQSATDDAHGLDLDMFHVEKGVKLEDADKMRLVLSKIREKRWALFVARAVDRYEAWWKTIQGPNSLTEDIMAEPVSELYSHFPILSKDPRGLREDMLPPLGAYNHHEPTES
jgi:hypothetical protein